MTGVNNPRIIEFAGRSWMVKSGRGLGPGPNCWSDSDQSVWVDQQGQLHLKIRQIDGEWHAVEVYTKECTRYGLHRFFLSSPLDKLDKNVVAAPFLYKDDQTEVDIEFARWGVHDSRYNAQYVVQPWDISGNLKSFPMTLPGTLTTHSIDWRAAAIHFRSLVGHVDEPSSATHIIHEWQYTGKNIPPENAGLQIHINLWLHKGIPPSDGQEVELIVARAQFPVPLITSHDNPQSGSQYGA